MKTATIAALLLLCTACSRPPPEFAVGECVTITATGAPGLVLKHWFSRRGEIVRVNDPTLPAGRIMVMREYANTALAHGEQRCEFPQGQ